MKLAFVNNEGILELRWTWLPLFIAQNKSLLLELHEAWKAAYPEGVPVHRAEEEAHDFTIKWLCERLKIPGLGTYLRSIDSVRM